MFLKSKFNFMKKMIGLFSGIGGFELAATWNGWKVVASCEISDFGNAVLQYRFPDAEHYRDIFEVDFTKYRGEVDLVCGGFPCQPFSVSGKRKGEEDQRYLWPQMFRAISEILPRFVIGENVPGLISINKGETLERVCTDLESLNYTVQLMVIPAGALGAIHLRERIWIIGINKNFGKLNEPFTEKLPEYHQKMIDVDWSKKPDIEPYLPKSFSATKDYVISGRKLLDNTHKAYGNAIVPQVAYQIIKNLEGF